MRVGETWWVPADEATGTPAEVVKVLHYGVGDDGYGHEQMYVKVNGPSGERELPVDWVEEHGLRHRPAARQ